MFDIPRKSTGTVRVTQTQNRRVMLISSGFFSSTAVAVRGSSAIPQIGQELGLGRTIWGCMGQTYSVVTARGAGTSGSKAMPHLGQAPGAERRISGSIGQV